MPFRNNPNQKVKFSLKSFFRIYGVAAFICLLINSLETNAQNNNSAKSIQKAVNELASKAELSRAQLGFAVYDLNNGNLVHGHQVEKVFCPASVMKLLSTFTALEVLGPAYKFKTYLAYKGTLFNDGVLDGDVLLIGDGDPTLASDHFKPFKTPEQQLIDWVAAVKKAGIIEIKGKLIINCAKFGTTYTPDDWPWGDLGNYYGASIAGININENLYRVNFSTGKPGEKAKIINTSPKVPNLIFSNEVKIGNKNSGDQCYIYGGPEDYRKVIKGTIPASDNIFSVRGSIPEPPVFVGNRLLELLKEEGIKCRKGLAIEYEVEAQQYTVIDSIESKKVIEIIASTNQYSINLFAEALLLKAYKEIKKKPLNQKDVAEWLVSYWENKGVTLKNAIINDGSGLSPSNAISPENIISLLDYASDRPDFLNTLPILGKTGTVYDLATGTEAEGKIILKSGSMSKILNYSGYVIDSNGKPTHAFVIFLSKYDGKYNAMRKALVPVFIELSKLSYSK